MRDIALKLGTLAGLVLVLVAALGFGLLGAKGTWTTQATIPAGTTAIIIDPDLASVRGPEISISAKVLRPKAGQAQLFVGRARPDDVSALVAKSSYLRVTGLKGARKLSTNNVAGEATMTAAPVADIWSLRALGAATVDLKTTAAPGAQTVLIATADGTALPELQVNISWINPAWLWIPGLLLLLGSVLLVVSLPLLRRLATPATLVAVGAGIWGQARQLSGKKTSVEPRGRRVKSPGEGPQEAAKGGERSRRRAGSRRVAPPAVAELPDEDDLLSPRPTRPGDIDPIAAPFGVAPGAGLAPATELAPVAHLHAPDPLTAPLSVVAPTLSATGGLVSTPAPSQRSERTAPWPESAGQESFFATSELPVVPQFLPPSADANLEVDPPAANATGLFPTGLFPAVEFLAAPGPEASPESHTATELPLTRRAATQRRNHNRRRR